MFHFPYHITTSAPATESKAIGVILLTHPRWIPSKLGKPYLHPNGRWIRQSYRGPLGIITVYAVYCRVNPTAENGGDNEWREILTDVSRQQAKGHAIILAGDMNMSYNWPHHRSKNDTYNHSHQHDLLTEASHRHHLTDTFLSLYPEANFKTWANTSGDWSSLPKQEIYPTPPELPQSKIMEKEMNKQQKTHRHQRPNRYNR